MKRGFPIGLVVLGALLTVGAFSWLYFGNATGNSATIFLPEQIVNLPRTEYRTGTQALAEFENLHGKQFPLTSGAIGIYGDQQVTIWAAGTSSDSIAAQMVDAMQDRIAEGNSPFTPVTEGNNNSRLVYILEGMGQKHFYFQSKNLVVWVAVDPALADTVIQEVLEAYP